MEGKELILLKSRGFFCFLCFFLWETQLIGLRARSYSRFKSKVNLHFKKVDANFILLFYCTVLFSNLLYIHKVYVLGISSSP